MKTVALQNNGDGVLIHPDFASQLGASDLFDACMSLNGEIVREVARRRTVRFTLNGLRYYAKIHTGVGWREVVKNLMRFTRPVLGAGDEQRAIERVTELGIPTTPIVAYGCRGRNPAARRSFLVTRDVGPTVSLEELAEHAATHGIDHNLKRRLINQTAEIARALHTHGINHRDFYLCHLEMDQAVMDTGDAQPGRLILMDLHRAQIRRRVPRRWVIKDLAALLFSSLDAPLTARDVLRFARRYRETSLRATLKQDGRLWRKTWNRALNLYESHWHRAPTCSAVSLARGCR